jgi:VanZ family protein
VAARLTSGLRSAPGIPLQRLSRAVFVAYLAAITFASLAPPRNLVGVGHYDKWFHLAAYVGLALVAWPALRSQASFRWGLLALALFGVGLEYLQSLIPGRDPSLWDGAANVAGLLVGGGAILGIQRLRGPP